MHAVVGFLGAAGMYLLASIKMLRQSDTRSTWYRVYHIYYQVSNEMLRQPLTKNVDYNAHTQQPTMFTLQKQSSHNFRNQQCKTVREDGQHSFRYWVLLWVFAPQAMFLRLTCSWYHWCCEQADSLHAVRVLAIGFLSHVESHPVLLFLWKRTLVYRVTVHERYQESACFLHVDI